MASEQLNKVIGRDQSQPQNLMRITAGRAAAIALLVACRVLVAPLGAQAASPSLAPFSNLASYDWSVKASRNLASNRPSTKASGRAQQIPIRADTSALSDSRIFATTVSFP